MPKNFRNRKIGNGEERDSPLTHDDERKIVELQNHKLTPREIAYSIGRPEQIVRKYLKKRSAEFQKMIMREYAELMYLEIGVLNEIEDANWENMENGNTAAAKIILDVIGRKNEIYGLTREHFDRLKREKEEKKESKHPRMLIRVEDWTNPDEPVEEMPDGTRRPLTAAEIRAAQKDEEKRRALKDQEHGKQL